jgi:hypothetical protein
MAKTLQFRRYNSATIANTTGASGELIVNTDVNTITVHDGSTAGGWQTPTLAYTQAAFAAANTANSSTSYQTGVSATQNTAITSVQALANTDYTTLVASASTYGNSTYIPVVTLSANGRVSSVVNTAITVGYTTGNGGLVTQLTSRTTAVSLNKPSGQITLFSQAMSNTTSNTFTFTNTTISANDFIMFNHWSGGTIGNYVINSNTGVGIANVTIRSISTVAAEAPVLQYVVIKGAAS